MSARNDGGPAFPRIGEGFGDPRYDAEGMNLRDWFAGQALQGDLAATDVGEALYEQAPENSRLMARRAYAYADAMLAERDRDGDA